LSRAEGTSTDNRISSSELCEGVGIAGSTDSIQISFSLLNYTNEIILLTIRGTEGKLISNRGRWSSLSLFRQIRLGEGKL